MQRRTFVHDQIAEATMADILPWLILLWPVGFGLAFYFWLDAIQRASPQSAGDKR